MAQINSMNVNEQMLINGTAPEKLMDSEVNSGLLARFTSTSAAQDSKINYPAVLGYPPVLPLYATQQVPYMPSPITAELSAFPLSFTKIMQTPAAPLFIFTQPVTSPPFFNQSPAPTNAQFSTSAFNQEIITKNKNLNEEVLEAAGSQKSELSLPVGPQFVGLSGQEATAAVLPGQPILPSLSDQAALLLQAGQPIIVPDLYASSLPDQPVQFTAVPLQTTWIPVPALGGFENVKSGADKMTFTQTITSSASTSAAITEQSAVTPKALNWVPSSSQAVLPSNSGVIDESKISNGPLEFSSALPNTTANPLQQQPTEQQPVDLTKTNTAQNEAAQVSIQNTPFLVGSILGQPKPINQENSQPLASDNVGTMLFQQLPQQSSVVQGQQEIPAQSSEASTAYGQIPT
ncbi:unnamed protein product [Gongylonema pulchrum]|uniref:Protein PRRC2C n=1 Tax=Gongylonema pulchrum TaxID=637853 RepID=A0A183D4V5_9BILA|nr:unnamed protein product [Gongylonema pulchrum]